MPSAWFGSWLAPLTASALVLLSLASPWITRDPLAESSVSLAALAAFGASGTDPIARNAPPAPSFRSTNDGGLAAHFGSLLIRQTNVFAR
ncbi:MAG: hypothetical protein KF833_13950 [Verrucomicrobiae bacterium]|nr:hypothetical protein [Verrucomicrobiae bacterium]